MCITGDTIMFNAAYTINEEKQIVVRTLETMLQEKGYRVGSIRKDELDTVHIKAVNKSVLGVLKYQLKRSRKLDPEAQRAAMNFSVIPGEQGQTNIFLSIFPIMEFYHLPEIPGVTESEEERKTDMMLCDSILTELAQAIQEIFPESEETFITRPMKRVYHLGDSRESASRDDVERAIIEILKQLKFEVIKTNHPEFNLGLEIIAVNKSFSHSFKERLKNRSLSEFLKSTQRISVRFTIYKPKLGYNHKLEMIVVMYPSMEVLGLEEIQSITQSLDEEIADSLLGKDLWEPLVEKLDEEFGEPADEVMGTSLNI